MMKTLWQPQYQPVLAGEGLAAQEPVLSVHSTQPAACSTRPRLRYSPADLPLWMPLPPLRPELRLQTQGRSLLSGLEGTHKGDMTQLILSLSRRTKSRESYRRSSFSLTHLLVVLLPGLGVVWLPPRRLCGLGLVA